MKQAKEFELSVPIEAPKADDAKDPQRLQVVLIDKSGRHHSQQLDVTPGKRATAKFPFEENPGKVTLLVGPADMSEEDLEAMQTIRRSVVTAKVADSKLELAPIVIGPFYWRYWLYWCRTFRIRGRVVCPNGAPVPGAVVCAHDVDFFWWWSSKQQIACATTNGDGEFELTFRWCCGYWPWWWWKARVWQLEPWLAERIVPALRQLPDLSKIPVPSPKPKAEVFQALLDPGGTNPLVSKKLDPDTLDAIRPELVAKLPALELAERFKLWPWWPWYPWWDCTPDVIFTVKQTCGGVTKTIIEESVSDVRSDIPMDLSVTLVARDACCVQDGEDPPGDCVVLAKVCDYLLDRIAGNPGAAASTPLGYVDSSTVTALPDTTNDRPFAGRLALSGVFGIDAVADYYEFEWSEDGGATWNPMPPAAAGGFTRTYWGPKVGTTDPADSHTVSFNFAVIDGKLVCESRQHFEANNDSSSWGATRNWIDGRDMLMNWYTANLFEDGTYRLRLRTWQVAGSNLVNSRILPLCATEDDNGLVVTIDNRLEGPGSGHPTASDHPCGDGTVHFCTTEPDTDILRVLVDGVVYDPCDIIPGAAGKELKIEFLAHDPDGHLGFFQLTAYYAESSQISLLPLGSLSSGAGVPSPVPNAAQVGPNYGNALAQGAVAPSWAGGTLTLTIPNMQAAFPVTCAYTIELRAHKRTIANCDTSLWGHWNRSQYSFTIQY